MPIILVYCLKKINIRHIWASILSFGLKSKKGEVQNPAQQFLQKPCREQLPAATATWPSHGCASINLEHTAQSILDVAGEVLPSALTCLSASGGSNNSRTGFYHRLKNGRTSVFPCAQIHETLSGVKGRIRKERATKSRKWSPGVWLKHWQRGSRGFP